MAVTSIGLHLLTHHPAQPLAHLLGLRLLHSATQWTLHTQLRDVSTYTLWTSLWALWPLLSTSLHTSSYTHTTAQRIPRRNNTDTNVMSSQYEVVYDGEEMTRSAFENMCSTWCHGLMHHLLCTLCLTGYEGNVHDDPIDTNASNTTDIHTKTTTSSVKIGHQATNTQSTSLNHNANNPVLVQVTNLPCVGHAFCLYHRKCCCGSLSVCCNCVAR